MRYFLSPLWLAFWLLDAYDDWRERFEEDRRQEEKDW